jgi:hypothetical protein
VQALFWVSFSRDFICSEERRKCQGCLPYLFSGFSLKQGFLARFGGGSHDGLGEWVERKVEVKSERRKNRKKESGRQASELLFVLFDPNESRWLVCCSLCQPQGL